MWRKGIMLWLLLGSSAVWANIQIVAAENFYGELARAIGQRHVTVSSILTNPNQDPHSFSVDFASAKAVSQADIVIYNGLGYDAWMDKLIAASPNPKRQVIVMANLLPNESNPHLWYNPAAMPILAQQLSQVLSLLDPEHKRDYQEALQHYLQAYQPLQDQVAQMRKLYAGIKVTATEPVFGAMATALGLEMLNQSLQWQVMNDASLTPRDVAAFEMSLRAHQAKVLIYNSQVSDPTTDRFKALAKENHIPLVGVSETEPAGVSYVQWMMSQLLNLQMALGASS